MRCKSKPYGNTAAGQNNFHVIIANGAVTNGIICAEKLFSIVTFEPFRQRLLRGRASGRFFCPFYGAASPSVTSTLPL